MQHAADVDRRTAPAAAGRSRTRGAAARGAPGRCRARRASVSIGSPGTRRISTKASSVMPMKVGTTRPSAGQEEAEHRADQPRKRARRPRGRSVAGRLRHGRSLRCRRRRRCGGRTATSLKSITSLRIGFELHRVRDREPRRLLLEDHLRLLVELGALGLVGDASWPSTTRSSNGLLHHLAMLPPPACAASQPSRDAGSCPDRRCRRSSRACPSGARRPACACGTRPIRS